MQSGQTPEIKDSFSDLNAPDVEQMKLQLEELVQQGVLSPDQAQSIMLQKSNMEDVSSDTASKQAQMDALLGLQEVTTSGGLTDMDRSKLNQIATEEETRSRGAREAIIQNAQARGMGGSGIELMAQMQNQQDSATRNASRDMDVAGMAQERALQALMSQGTLAGNINEQDFNQKATKANAMDEIAKFNAQNKQHVNLTNTAANNAAQAANLNAKQNIADSNVGTRNAQQQYNKQLLQQNFDNEMKKRSGQVGVAQYNSGAVGDTSKQEADAFNKTIGTGLTAAKFLSDERCKEDIEEFDPSDFLDSLTGYKYNYKDKKNGEGLHAGVMAQDLEKSEIGSKLVSEGPQGKMVNYEQAAPAMLASLASLNKRLKELEKSEGNE